MTTKATERDLVTEVEELLAKVPAWKLIAFTDTPLTYIGYYEEGHKFHVAQVSTFEGQRINHPLAQLFAESPELLRRLVEEVKRLNKRIKTLEHDAREDARDAANEARWQERQGEDYGSY